jgi:hypothetical protein
VKSGSASETHGTATFSIDRGILLSYQEEKSVSTRLKDGQVITELWVYELTLIDEH